MKVPRIDNGIPATAVTSKLRSNPATPNPPYSTTIARIQERAALRLPRLRDARSRPGLVRKAQAIEKAENDATIKYVDIQPPTPNMGSSTNSETRMCGAEMTNMKMTNITVQILET
mmetsp:Transcript_21539/g.61438  ORF Transcript_21539/g.61438 Transcript_21539/m.61438 type:complete len:116 (+) Transcript_21539:662-1009(+)